MKQFMRFAAMALLTAALTANVFAAEKFTPSVEQKDAPEVVAPKTEHKVDGSPAIIVKDEKGKVINAQPVETLKITPVSSFAKKENPKQENADGTETTEPVTEATEPVTEEEKAVKESLIKVYKEIEDANSLDEIVPELPKVLKELKVRTKVEELVVQDLVNISVPEEMVDALKIEGNTLDVTFKFEIEEGKELIILVQDADGEWFIVYGDDIVIEDDGTITVSFPAVGNVAFIVA